MRYDEQDRESQNVEDRRNQQGGMFPGGAAASVCRSAAVGSA